MKRRTFLQWTGAAAAGIWGLDARAKEGDPAGDAALTPGPGFPIADTHVHFWNPDHLPYSWIEGSEVLDRAFLPTDYSEHAGDIEVESIVFVEAGGHPDNAYDEAVWVDGLAEEDPRIEAIVAYAPLEKGDEVEADLEKLDDIPRVRGVRRLLQGEGDSEFPLRPGYVEGVQRLAKRDWVCELGINRQQYEAAIELCKRCPEVRFVLNHLGAPNIAGQELDPWRKHIEAFAELPNVWCKVSGAATLADHDDWTAEDLRPFIMHVIGTFGADRCCFGSDWPVLLRAGSFPQWVEALDTVTHGLSEDERHKLWRDTSRDVFGA